MKSEISERAAGSEQAPLHAPWFKEAVRVSNLYLAKDAASPAKKHEASFLQCMGKLDATLRAKLPQKVQGHYLQYGGGDGDPAGPWGGGDGGGDGGGGGGSGSFCLVGFQTRISQRRMGQL